MKAAIFISRYKLCQLFIAFSLFFVFPYTLSAKPLEISKVQASDITGDSAIISWELNDKASGYVQYGRSRNVMYKKSEKETSFTLNKHKQALSGLRPHTTYFYRVHSTSQKNDTVSSAIASFRTPAAGVSRSPAPVKSNEFAISNLSASDVTHDSAVVQWELNKKGTGYVEFGKTRRFGEKTRAESSFKFDAHRHTVAGLEPNTTYYYRARSASKDNKFVASDIKKFTTSSVAEHTPFKITDVRVSELKDGNAIIEWKLTQVGSGVVEYGTGYRLGSSSQKEASFEQDKHQHTITGLKPDTFYYYRVKSVKCL